MRSLNNTHFFSAFVLACAVMTTGCDRQTGIGSTGVGALTGTAIGAGLGAIVGNQVGSTGAGIAIGSGIGALSGGAIGYQGDLQDERLDNQENRISAQGRVLEENRRLIEELRGRGADARSSSRGVVVNFPDVLFEFDSARLTREARFTTRDIAEVLQESAAGRRIAIEGHTDSKGTVAYNQRLSEARAREVADELRADGIPRSKISVRGFGETDPISTNSTSEGRQRNRRVEVIIENR